MIPLGAYHLPTATKTDALDDRRVARLRAAWPSWESRTHPLGGALLVPSGSARGALDLSRPGVPCDDGMNWHPPQVMPTLYDLAREEMPQPSVVIRLRRIGDVSLPLGVGPVYGAGPKRGKPSSPFGLLAFDLFARGNEPDHVWTADDERDVERLLFLAFQQGYSLTEELFAELAPYDLDEINPILQGIWGCDPKASASDGPTSPPSPQGSSPIRG